MRPARARSGRRGACTVSAARVAVSLHPRARAVPAAVEGQMRSVVKSLAFMAAGVAALAAAPAASAQVPVPLTVTGNSARALVDLPGGFGVELTLTFEQVVGLHPRALEVTAALVDPSDPALIGRLPAPVPPAGGLPGGPTGAVTIPAALPVLLRVSPPSSSALSFEGVASVSLYTHNLQLEPSMPLALYKAHDGGPFSDITVSEGRGSYRAGGSTGDFSEFLIVMDTRPIDIVIGEKFTALQALLDEHSAALPALLADNLAQRLARAQAFYQGGLLLLAMTEVRGFSRTVATQSGADVPNVWRANCGGANVAGLLRSAADTLRFSIDRKAGR